MLGDQLLITAKKFSMGDDHKYGQIAIKNKNVAIEYRKILPNILGQTFLKVWIKDKKNER